VESEGVDGEIFGAGVLEDFSKQRVGGGTTGAALGGEKLDDGEGSGLSGGHGFFFFGGAGESGESQKDEGDCRMGFHGSARSLM
jgi:hypothetical protein